MCLFPDPRPRVYLFSVLLFSSSISILLLVFAIHLYYLLGVWDYYFGTTPIMASYICGIIGYVVSILHHLFLYVGPAGDSRAMLMHYSMLLPATKIDSRVSILDIVLLVIEIMCASPTFTWHRWLMSIQ
jgi:hypothetical protein